MLIESNGTDEIGNKAKNLYALQKHGVRVPPFIVIPFDKLKNLLDGSSVDYTKENIEKIYIPDIWIDEILQFHVGCKNFAVRSSSGVEDSNDKSYAGQFLTILNVSSNELKESIKEVWLSVFAKHIKVYNNSNTEQIPISIIIQQCIEAEVSGVIFTHDPLNGDKEISVINAVYGLGEGLVSGILDADMYQLKSNSILSKTIANKKEKMVYSSTRGLHVQEVENTLMDIQAMSDKDILNLYSIAKNLEHKFGYAQDIEFCIRNKDIYILQCRPITTISSSTNYLIWDNSNIVESYPGVTLPLTYSFISPVYSAVYKQLSAVLGINKKEIEKNSFTYDNMLGLLRGRVYYNLYSWFKLLSLLPGYSLNASFMEKMMGVSEKFELEDYQKPSGLKEYFNIGRLIVSMISNAIFLPKMRRKFRENFYLVLQKHKNIKIENANAFTCMHAYLNFENTLAKEWKAPLVNDFFAMIYYGVFQKFIAKNEKYFKHGNNYYLSGTGKVITIQPAILQQEICSMIRNNKELTELFNSNEETIFTWIKNNSNHELSIKFKNYIHLWGDRCFAELKLETITYREDPLSFIRIIQKTYKQAVQINTDNNQVDDLSSLPWFKKAIFVFLKKRTIDTVSERENLRYERTRAFAEVRQIFLRLGELFFTAGIIENKRDIFYLGKEEIFNFIRGSALQINLKEIVNYRKQEYTRFIDEPEQSARIRTDDMVYINSFANKSHSDESDLKGIPCCKGVVKARVKIVHSPEDISGLEGKIMLTISTDPGWVSVFPLVAGIIVERGSVLSHAAIVSREMNIPCIVGVKNITSHLKDNQLIEMDGLSGIIKIIDES